MKYRNHVIPGLLVGHILNASSATLVNETSTLKTKLAQIRDKTPEEIAENVFSSGYSVLLCRNIGSAWELCD